MAKVAVSDQLDRLIVVGEGQDGFFTTSQAEEQGLTRSALHRLETRELVERSVWGVYRLSKWPYGKYSGFWPIYLWYSSRTIIFAFSHRTALALHDVSDVNAPKVMITVPRAIRIRGQKPPAVAEMIRDLEPKDIVRIDGLPVTSLKRTLFDLILDRIALEAVVEVLSLGPTAKLPEKDYDQVLAFHDLPRTVIDFIARNAPARRGRPPSREALHS
jgi:predicted transcriptional regulator of viral defense system